MQEGPQISYASDPEGAVLDRLQQVYEVSTDAALARAMGLPGSTVGSWRKRGRVPDTICIGVHDAKGVSLDWLLTGVGPREARVAETPHLAAAIKPEGNPANSAWVQECYARVQSACAEAGFSPGPFLLNALQTIAVFERVTNHGLALLVRAMKEEVEDSIRDHESREKVSVPSAKPEAP